MESQFIRNKALVEISKQEKSNETKKHELDDFCELFSLMKVYVSYEKEKCNEKYFSYLGMKYIDVDWCNNFHKDKNSFLATLIICNWGQTLRKCLQYQVGYYLEYCNLINLLVENGMCLNENEKVNYFNLSEFYTYGDANRDIVPYEILDLLGNLGVDLTVQNNNQSGIIYKAFIYADDRMIDILFKHGLSIDYRSLDGYSLLDLVVWPNCKLPLVKKMISMGANIHDENKHRTTPLIEMIKNFRVDLDELIEALQEVGIDQDTRTSPGGPSLREIRRYRKIHECNCCFAVMFGACNDFKNKYC